MQRSYARRGVRHGSVSWRGSSSQVRVQASTPAKSDGAPHAAMRAHIAAHGERDESGGGGSRGGVAELPPHAVTDASTNAMRLGHMRPV